MVGSGRVKFGVAANNRLAGGYGREEEHSAAGDVEEQVVTLGEKCSTAVAACRELWPIS